MFITGVRSWQVPSLVLSPVCQVPRVQAGVSPALNTERLGQAVTVIHTLWAGAGTRRPGTFLCVTLCFTIILTPFPIQDNHIWELKYQVTASSVLCGYGRTTVRICSRARKMPLDLYLPLLYGLVPSLRVQQKIYSVRAARKWEAFSTAGALSHRLSSSLLP